MFKKGFSERGSKNSFPQFSGEFVHVTGTLAGSDCAVNGREAAWWRRNRDENGQASGTFARARKRKRAARG